MVTRNFLGIYLCTLKFHLMGEIGIPWPDAFSFATNEQEFTPVAVRWKAHLSSRLGPVTNSAGLMNALSSGRTIAVVGDIRKSQDLMTYAQDSASFSEYMVQFIDGTRRIIDEHLGFFDKFTGDGFVTYFCENLCKQEDEDFVDCFLRFAQAESEMCSALFKEWAATVRKLPPSPVGLSIGADVGKIDFRDLQSHLVAVGDTIVWASRMSSAGQAGETVVNNRLYEMLLGRPESAFMNRRDRYELTFEERDDNTKAGEAFKARVIKFTKNASKSLPSPEQAAQLS